MIGTVIIDFKKAFDLVDHSLLLKKLKHYKLSNDKLLWFASYLSKRKQKVSLNNITSDDEMITDGVPQGSILGGGGRVVRRCWVNFQCRGVLQF